MELWIHIWTLVPSKSIRRKEQTFFKRRSKEMEVVRKIRDREMYNYLNSSMFRLRGMHFK
jgi:hypothetical protein